MRERGKVTKVPSNKYLSNMWISHPSIDRGLSLQLQSSPPSQVQSCVIVIVVVNKVSPRQGIGHLRDDRLVKDKMATFCFLHYICDICCEYVDNDDRKECDMITKAFVKKSQNWSLNAPKKLIPKNPQKSRDENFRLIPSRKIPGSRDFAKIPSRKSRD